MKDGLYPHLFLSISLRAHCETYHTRYSLSSLALLFFSLVAAILESTTRQPLRLEREVASH